MASNNTRKAFCDLICRLYAVSYTDEQKKKLFMQEIRKHRHHTDKIIGYLAGPRVEMCPNFFGIPTTCNNDCKACYKKAITKELLKK